MKREQVEMLRRQYPEGTQVVLECMEGERQMYAGLKGRVYYVDDIGQIHVQWENGSTLALEPQLDKFHKVEESKKDRGGISR